MKTLTISILMMIVAIGAFGQNTYYIDDVATNGTGTLANPWNDFQTAFNSLRSGDVLNVNPGTYTLSNYVLTKTNGSSTGRITIKATDPNNKPLIQRNAKTFRIEHAYYTLQDLILEGMWGSEAILGIKGNGDNTIIRNCIIRKVKSDGIEVREVDDVLVENTEIYYCLRGTSDDMVDAHGIVGYRMRNMTVRGCNIHQVSGDCIQTDPVYFELGPQHWDNLLIENCTLWTGPLPETMAGFAAGSSPGENAIDTKTYEEAIRPEGYRPTIIVRNTEVYGFEPSSVFNDRAALNIKHNVECTLENVKVHGSNIAFRLRGAYEWNGAQFGGAHVTMKNCIAYNNQTTIWFERAIDFVHSYNCTFDKSASGNYFSFRNDGYTASGFDMRNCAFVGTKPIEASHTSNKSATTACFVNTASRNYQLASGSSCINSGVTVTEVTTDITGAVRNDGQYDVGAYEYGSASGTTDTQAPSVPAGLSTSSVTQASFTINWNVSTDNVGVTGYEVFRNGTSLGTTNSTSLAVSGLTCNTTYAMRVRARDAAGNWSAQSTILNVTTSACSTTTDTQAPNIPSGLTASAITQTSFTLSWNASTDNVGVTGYEVFRNGASLGTTNSLAMNITGITCGTSYSMTVRARDAAGNWSGNSTALSVTTSSCPVGADTQAPSVPIGLASSGVTTSSFNLSWAASTDNIGVYRYEIYMNDSYYAVKAGSTTDLKLTGLTSNTTYAMKVRARDEAGNWSAFSEVLNVTTNKKSGDTTSTVTAIGTPEILESRAYPNPVVSELTIDLSSVDGNETCEIELMTITGKIVTRLTECQPNEIQTIDLNNTPKGIYMLKVSQGNRVKVEKIIKK